MKTPKKILLVNIGLFVVLFFSIEFNKSFLRPAFGRLPFWGELTGSLPNFLAALLIGLTAVSAAFFKNLKHKRLIVYLAALFVFVILAFEERFPLWGASTQYDILDIVASALGSVLVVIVFEMINYYHRQ